MTRPTLGPYAIIEELGGGGMGAVYRVETPDGPAALKVLSPGFDAPKMLERFRREAEALRRIDHPGFVRYIDHGTDLETAEGNRPFLLMEYVPGPSLRERVRSGTLDVDDALDIATELCVALGHAHELGIVHRDIKPENVILDERTGKPRILDLGIVRLTDDWWKTVDTSTRSGELLGTVRYMSPEQASGKVAEIGSRSDIYSLAVVVYELLSARLPYDVRDETLHELLVAILTESPVSLRRHRPDLSLSLDAVLRSALSKSVGERPASMQAFAEQLRAAQEGGKGQLIRTVSRGVWRRKLALGRALAIVGGLALLLALILLPREPARSDPLPGVYRKLQAALELVHFGDRGPEQLRAAIDSLSSAREDLWGIELPWKAPLERYMAIRLGEAAYILGVVEQDPERLRWSTARYEEAQRFTCTTAERDAIPLSSPVREEILKMGLHMPYAGHAMAHAALAGFNLPLRHLEFAEISGRSGVMFLQEEATSPRWDGPPIDPFVPLRHQRIARAIQWNDYGATLSELAAVTDSLELFEKAIRCFPPPIPLPNSRPIGRPLHRCNISTGSRSREPRPRSTTDSIRLENGWSALSRFGAPVASPECRPGSSCFDSILCSSSRWVSPLRTVQGSKRSRTRSRTCPWEWKDGSMLPFAPTRCARRSGPAFFFYVWGTETARRKGWIYS